MITEPYLDQAARWPAAGRHILAHYDAEHIIVYQAYRPGIGHFAARRGYFGGDFSLNRMSWIKPNFLWMMYRSAWGTQENQTVILAIWLHRDVFDHLLAQAVHSSFVPGLYADHAAWKTAVAGSSVRLQWDPDHDPAGGKGARRAIQLGLRGEVLAQYAQGDWIARIEDISAFVAEQHPFARPDRYADLVTPQERVYPVDDAGIARRLQLSSPDDADHTGTTGN